MPKDDADWSGFAYNAAANFDLEKTLQYLFERGPVIDGVVPGPQTYRKSIVFKDLPAKLERAMQYVDSGNVIRMRYLEEGDHVFVKGEVLVSYKTEVHNTTVAISLVTGDVCDALCEPCKVKDLRRCNHVAALLLRILGFHSATNRGNYSYTWTESRFETSYILHKRVETSPNSVLRAGLASSLNFLSENPYPKKKGGRGPLK